jgi:two-component sensor histidine kinase
VNRESEGSGWIAAKWAGLSTALKMLLILSLGLLPLGIIAVLASIQTARDNNIRRLEETQARVEIKAQRLNSSLSRSALTIRAASAATAGAQSDICEVMLRRLSGVQPAAGRYALFASDGNLRCASPGFLPPSDLVRPRAERSIVRLSDDEEALHFALYDERGEIEGIGELSRRGLSEMSYIPGTSPNFTLYLVQGDRRMVLRDNYKDGPFVQTVHAEAPVAGGRLTLEIAAPAPPIGTSEFLMMILPVLMWIFSAIIGWFIVNGLLLRPLGRMQRAVASYQPGDRNLDLPRSATPAREIGELGAAFDRVTRTVARHEAELEDAVERQRRLVREVHHRVKNNLQVVASLLNLHSRGSPNEEVAAAYASIQRRVDALAVVHRNHYAELEENRGVSMRSLISELGANLRATAPPSASKMLIRLDIEPFYATQDVAVSVAFLITEIVEYAMFCEGHPVTISLLGDNDGVARLTVQSDSLKKDIPCDELLTDRFTRIVTGLSRQLRSTIDRDEEAGRYSLDINVVDKGES